MKYFNVTLTCENIAKYVFLLLTYKSIDNTKEIFLKDKKMRAEIMDNSGFCQPRKQSFYFILVADTWREI